MTRPERSKQERRIARGREADAAFDRIFAEALARARAHVCPGYADTGCVDADCDRRTRPNRGLDTKATPMVYSNYGARNRAPHTTPGGNTMRVAATNVLPGDRVRGIGLVVDDVVPESDFTTAITGHVSTREDDGEFDVFSGVKIVLPNEHLVNVVRSDENFRADRVQAVAAALETYNAAEYDGEDETASTALITELHRIAAMPRGASVEFDPIVDLVQDGSVQGDAEEVLTKLDALAV